MRLGDVPVRLTFLSVSIFCGPIAFGASIVNGSGANPPATATGIYDIARVTTDGGQVMNGLALVHRGSLREIHSRSASGKFQPRESGSTAIRISPSKYAQLLAVSGGLNRDVNKLGLDKRCEFYALAGLDRTGMNCPASTTPGPAPAPTSSGECPPGQELVVQPSVGPDGRKVFSKTCRLITRRAPGPSAPRTQTFGERMAAFAERLIPIATAEARILQLRFKSALFTAPISFDYFSAEASGTDFGGWRFEGLGFNIIWANDGP